jgi:hypothetical protein
VATALLIAVHSALPSHVPTGPATDPGPPTGDRGVRPGPQMLMSAVPAVGMTLVGVRLMVAVGLTGVGVRLMVAVAASTGGAAQPVASVVPDPAVPSARATHAATRPLATRLPGTARAGAGSGRPRRTTSRPVVRARPGEPR